MAATSEPSQVLFAESAITILEMVIIVPVPSIGVVLI